MTSDAAIAGQQAAQHGDRDRTEQEQQQRAGDTHRVAQRDQREHEQRNADEGTDPRESPSIAPTAAPVGGTLAARTAARGAGPSVGRDDVHVDRTGAADHLVDDRAPGQLGPSGSVRRSHDDLRRVLGTGEAHEHLRRVGADDLRRTARRARRAAPRCRSNRPSSGLASPSALRTCTPTSSARERDAIRAPRRMRCSPPARRSARPPPVRGSPRAR